MKWSIVEILIIENVSAVLITNAVLSKRVTNYKMIKTSMESLNLNGYERSWKSIEAKLYNLELFDRVS